MSLGCICKALKFKAKFAISKIDRRGVDSARNDHVYAPPPAANPAVELTGGVGL